MNRLHNNDKDNDKDKDKDNDDKIIKAVAAAGQRAVGGFLRRVPRQYVIILLCII